MKAAILSWLPQNFPWEENICWFDTIDSTNDALKVMARQGAPHGTVVLSDHQTGGHGRRGRSFHSPAGSGVYMSVLLRPECKATELMHLTCAAAVAMCDAVQAAAGFRPGIKWTNDLVSGKRKLGGILTELGFSPQGEVDYAIIGVGINCSQQETDFPHEIQSIAASLTMVAGQSVDRFQIAAAMMEAFQKMDLAQKERILHTYRKDCITIGQNISLVRGDAVRYGTALDVDSDGALIVRFSDGTIEAVNSGEVSVRGMYGYL